MTNVAMKTSFGLFLASLEKILICQLRLCSAVEVL